MSRRMTATEVKQLQEEGLLRMEKIQTKLRTQYSWLTDKTEARILKLLAVKDIELING